MDWVVTNGIDGAAPLRREIARYLRRHGEPTSDFTGAELAFSELYANALRHAPGPAWVTIDWPGRQPVVTVHDLGPGFELESLTRLPEPTATGGRGLFIASQLVSDLAAEAKRSGGSRVSARLPVTRKVEVSYDPPPPLQGALPTSREAGPDGMFGKESFLRALVVQLGQAMESLHGPPVAELTVAQVGAAVGGRMEAEYRDARDLVDRLDPDEIGDLYVRLKAAIGGGFTVTEATDEKIVLTNTRCPFGDVVKTAPGLCRMTSSVFGGIGARNSPTGTASVVLEERIAVGDPGCKVVVWLVPPPEPVAEIAHVYRSSGITAGHDTADEPV